MNDCRENVNSFFGTNLSLVNNGYMRRDGHIHIVCGIMFLIKSRFLQGRISHTYSLCNEAISKRLFGIYLITLVQNLEEDII